MYFPALARAFKEAKLRVNNGDSRTICLALDIANEQGKLSGFDIKIAKEIIITRLGKEIYCELWLISNVSGLTFKYLFNSDEGREQMRLYRLRWLDTLIAEFS